MRINQKSERTVLHSQASLDIVANPNLQVVKTKQMLYEVVSRAREEMHLVTNRKARTLLETTIALVQGLLKAYEHFEGCWEQKKRSQKSLDRVN